MLSELNWIPRFAKHIEYTPPRCLVSYTDICLVALVNYFVFVFLDTQGRIVEYLIQCIWQKQWKSIIYRTCWVRRANETWGPEGWAKPGRKPCLCSSGRVRASSRVVHLFETQKLMPTTWKLSFQKPKAPAFPSTEEDPCLSFPKPPVDPAKMRRISSARARLFRAASQGALLPDRTLLPAERKAK